MEKPQRDGLDYDLLTFEETEFLEERGWQVTNSLQSPPHQIAGRNGMFYTARLLLHRVLAPWGGDLTLPACRRN